MYKAPIEEIAFTLKHIGLMKRDLSDGALGDLTEDLVDAILAEAGRFATDAVAPLAQTGDRQGARLIDGRVVMPDGWRDLYSRWREGGWNALTGPVDFGGQDLPETLGVAAMEMWNSASMAFGLGPMLTMGAVEALSKHASPELQARYLPKLVSGEWMGTMNLTEPQAGSDLGTLKTRAIPEGDGTYRIFGQKIFITYGEHDLTDNIVHLVLARLPDAPAGTRGISLFLVPKFLVEADGALGGRNDVLCASIEHKLGIHGSPTCTMIYGDGCVEGEAPGAVGYLIGEENRGLACMFTMMNSARLNVGMQGVAVAEAAFQHARAYASERRQGKAPGATTSGTSTIIEHPDIQRTLLTMKAQIFAARAICYSCAAAIDRERRSEGDSVSYWRERANLLTPIAKAYSTHIGVEVACSGIQVHGGMGFIEETGAAVYYRDARIAPIYEGTNGIQAIDLVTRKLQQSGGEHIRGYIAELREEVDRLRKSTIEGFGRTADRVSAAIDDLDAASEHLLRAHANDRHEDVLAGATPYLRLIALASGGALHIRAALASSNPSRIALAHFFADHLIVQTAPLRLSVTDGVESILAARNALP